MNQSSLLILVTGDPVPAVHREIGDFPTLIKRTIGPAWSSPWFVVDARESLPERTDWAGVIITGSPESLTDIKPWMPGALNYVRSLVEARVPTFGICFGHQMLGVALGGRVQNNPNGREIGTVDVRLHAADSLQDLLGGEHHESTFRVNMTHMDSVVQLPEGASVLASTALEPHAMVRFGPTAWGVQFHPEFDQPVMRGYIDHRRDQLQIERFDGAALHAGAQDTPTSAALMRGFVQSLVPVR